MENPCLTFVTPTLLAGDRSLTNVVAHEVAHSWTVGGRAGGRVVQPPKAALIGCLVARAWHCTRVFVA
jgi:hypothetical protein